MTPKEATLLPAVEESKALAPLGDPMLAMIERIASSPTANVDNLERLIALKERGQAKLAEQEFNAAMSAAQSDMRRVGADSENPQTKSRYASYAALDRALRPIYTKHGFGLSFDTGADAPTDIVRMLCYVTHIAGHSRTYRCDMPADGKGAKGGDVMTKTHAAGSAMSYGMRYLLKMIFNVAIGEDDDDGNRASATPPRHNGRAPAVPAGFDDWRHNLEAVADEGTAALETAWKASKNEYRAHMTQHYSREWFQLKAKATKVAK